ncbi:RHS repeat domain-containing protein [Chryseobacterium sp. c4a]|uniref:RHS repeat domain-containing protein n=1 Tax=Chryseobacterium sp. c4a TaxID=1573582 RepID=UPI00135904B2|nr:RHS repeat domain-containing protein [Chryseobacterium sp. c4a]
MKKIMALAAILPAIMMWGQTLELPKNIQSPNAASLGKYGDIDMNLFTGRANVSVPLYSLNEGNIPLNITLNYDTGGVRINDVSGWVGQNWSLEAGGVITRQIRTNSDEAETPEYSDIPNSKIGYYYSRPILNTANWADNDRLINLATHAGLPNRINDLEPDIFTFNFMGYSGKFFLGEDGQWKVSSKSNIKVSIDMMDNVVPMNYPTQRFCNNDSNTNLGITKSIGKITIWDDKGNKFIFGGQMNAIEFSNSDFFNQYERKINANAWYLAEVYNNLGEKIYSFDYERGNFQATFYNNHQQILHYEKISNGTLVNSCSGTSFSNEVLAEGQLIFPVFLKRINGLKTGIKLNFLSEELQNVKYDLNPIRRKYNPSRPNDPDYEENPLSAKINRWIQLNVHNGNAIDNYRRAFYYLINPIGEINYDFCVNININTAYDTKSLLDKLKWRKLSKISIEGPISKNINFTYDEKSYRLWLKSVKNDDRKYSFLYNITSLPSYLSKSVDHFGYYNGNPFGIDPNTHNTDRNTNSLFVDYGMLSEITYPTGGTTTLEYEPHTYSKYVKDMLDIENGSGITGGVRIKKIINSNHWSDPNKTIKEYLYQDNINSNISSGTLIQNNKYYYVDFKTRFISGSIFKESVFSINSVIPQSNIFGSQIEYSTVIEKETGKGYIINKYSNYVEDGNNIKYVNTINPDYTMFFPKIDMGFKRGHIKNRSFFDQNGSKLKEEEYIYEIHQNNNKVRAVQYNNENKCPQNSGDLDLVIKAQAYEIYFSDYNLTRKKTTEFNGANVLETNEYNNYNTSNYETGNLLLKKQSVQYPDVGIKETNYQYAYDKNIQKLINANMIGIPLETTISNKQNKTDLEKITSKIEAKYDDPATLFPTSVISYGIETQTPSTEVTYDKYDSKGNLLQYTTKDGAVTVIIWGYNKTQPIAKIENIRLTDIQQSFIDSIVNASDLDAAAGVNNDESNLLNTFKTFRANLLGHQVTTYSYDPLVGVRSITPPSGIRETYLYDAANRLEKVVDANGKLLKELKYNYKN